MLVSTIIPAHNRAHYIVDAIKDALRQLSDNHEVIVVDDGSSDNTAEIVTKMMAMDQRIRLIRHATNRGVSDARNTGVDAAQGIYVAFFDSDDRWNWDKLKKQIALLESSPGALEDKFCFTHYRYRISAPDISRFWHEIPKVFMPLGRIYSDQELERAVVTYRLWLFPGSTLLAHRDALKKTGPFDERLGLGEDTEIVIRHMARGGKLCMVPQLLASYTRPGPEKIYKSSINYYRFMLTTYQHVVTKNWGVRVGQEFADRMHLKSASLDLDAGSWRTAAREVLSLSARAQDRTPQFRQALAHRLWCGLMKKHAPSSRAA
jgi:GT2 family glycosyltransferase